MKRLLCSGVWVLILISLGARVWAEPSPPPAPSLWRGMVSALDPRTWPFIPIPEVSTDPNGGTTVGILPVFLFTDPQHQIYRIIDGDVTQNPTLGVGASLQILSYPSSDVQWSATIGGAERIARSVDLFYTTGLNRERWWSFEGRLYFERDPTERFFGVGNRSREGSETNYTLEEGFASARLGVNFSRAVQLAFELRPRIVDIQRGAFDSLPFTGARFPALRGVRRASNEVLSRVSLSYDTRDSLNVPRKGSLVTLWGGMADQRLLSSVSYSMFGVEARHYIPLSQRFTLATHAAIRYMPVGRQTPFWALSRLGGDRSTVGFQQPLRGFGAGRFVDRHLFAANAELRTRVLERDIFGTHAVLELAPFIDLGRVVHDFNENPLSGLHPVGGIGFRGLAAPFVVGYVDVGYGSEGIAVFSGVNYPF